MELVSPDSFNISPQIPRDVLSSSSSYETYNFKHRSIVEREQKMAKTLIPYLIDFASMYRTYEIALFM